MVSLDTNAVLALIIEERKEQREKVLRLFTGNICHIADLVFPELEYILTKVYGFPREHVVASINTLITNKNLRCNVALLIDTLALYAYHPALSFVDCCLAIEAGITRRTPLHTFDKKLFNQSAGLAQLII